MTSGDVPPDEYMDLEDVRKALGVSRSRAYVVTRDREFPDPVMVRPRYRVWRRSDVEAYLDAKRPGWRDA